MSSDHALFIAHDQGVWLLKLKVFITATQWALSWTGSDGQDYAHTCSTQCLRDTISLLATGSPPVARNPSQN